MSRDGQGSTVGPREDRQNPGKEIQRNIKKDDSRRDGWGWWHCQQNVSGTSLEHRRMFLWTSHGRVCVVPGADGRWHREIVCTCYQGWQTVGRKQHGREKIFLIPFCPALSQSGVCFAMFGIFSKKSCLSFLVGHIADIYITDMPCTLFCFTQYIFLLF